MVKFVTTEYTHLYGNSYAGRSKYGRGKHTLVGERVEKMRKRTNLSVGDVCVAVGVAPSIYESFLEGRYRFDRQQLASLAETLGVSIHDIFHEKDRSSPKVAAALKARNTPHKIRVKRTKATGAKSKSKKAKRPKGEEPEKRAYDADAAAALLATKFKVKRA